MEKVINNEWIVDIVTNICRNKTNNIVVAFEKNRKILIGKIKSIPLELVKEWTKENQVEANINNMIKEAEDSFMKAYVGW